MKTISICPRCQGSQTVKNGSVKGARKRKCKASRAADTLKAAHDWHGICYVMILMIKKNYSDKYLSLLTETK